MQLNNNNPLEIGNILRWNESNRVFYVMKLIHNKNPMAMKPIAQGILFEYGEIKYNWNFYKSDFQSGWTIQKCS